MIRNSNLCAAAVSSLLLLADDPLTVQEIQGEHAIRSYCGKVVGTGDNLVL